MNRWLKRNGKWVVVGLGVVFIFFGIVSIAATEEKWMVVLNAILIALWVALILIVSGALNRIFTWWKWISSD